MHKIESQALLLFFEDTQKELFLNFTIMAAVYAWGEARSGTLGTNNSEHDILASPHQIQSLQDTEIRNISCAENHTLVCLQDGTVRISGSRCLAQHSGQEKLAEFEPLREGLEANQVIEVAAGSSHSVVLTQTHKVFTWGKNDCGQLGRGDIPTETQEIPRPVDFLAQHSVLQVACGNSHTIVLTDGGLVAAWGSNFYGQLGMGQNNTNPHLNKPEFLSSLKKIPGAQVTAGGNHSFMLSMTGAVYGWGRNNCGQLGMNDTQDKFLPNECQDLQNKNVQYICCGENHTACLTLDGEVFTFGDNSHGQLGHSNNKNVISPERTVYLPDFQVSQIDCGSNHTLIYVPASGSLYSFGLGRSGQLGHSDTENKSSPVLVQDLSQQEMDNQGTKLIIKSIYAGGDHSFVVTQDVNGVSFTDYFVTMDLKTKYRLIEIESNRKMMREIKGAQLLSLDEVMRNGLKPVQPFNPQGLYLILSVSTKTILRDAHAQLQGRPVGDLKKPLKVFFIDQPPVFEMIMRKEFFNLFFQAVKNTENGFFKKEDKDRIWFEKNAVDKLDMFKTIGIICGLAIYNSVLVNLPFPLALYKKLLKRPVSLRDLQDFVPVPRSGFQETLDTNVTGTYDTFQYTGSELCPGGKDKEITEENKKEFVDMAVDFILNKSIEAQFSAFNQGFYTVCDGELLKLLHPRELEALLVGNADYDFKILEANTKYTGDYNKNHPTIKLFWEVVHEMTLENQKKLLLFFRASDRIPVSGMASVELTIQPDPRQLHMLPSAYTCDNLLMLKLPRYKAKKVMIDRLHRAIVVQGFHLNAP